MEGGNSLYQPLLDEYIAGGDVPLSQVQQVWQNTTQPNVGYSLLYQEIFPLVRRINTRLPQARKLRVLACDPPIDWSTIVNHEGFAKDNDELEQARHLTLPLGQGGAFG